MWATRTRPSPRTSSPATGASAARRRSFSRARTSTAPTSRAWPRRRGSSRRSSSTGTRPKFLEMTRRVNASNDFFIRTTDERHEALVQEFLQRIYDAGEIYEGVYAGLYCQPLRVLLHRGRARRRALPAARDRAGVRRGEELLLPPLGLPGPAARALRRGPEFVLPRFRANEARSFIEQGLADISVSRATQRWGVPVPWDPDQVVYVWVDALINYWSALAFAREGEDLRPSGCGRRFGTSSAKDILKFHCVIWPALLMAAGIDRAEASSSCTGTCCWTTGRCPSRSATSSTRSSWSTSTAWTRCGTTSSGRRRSARTGTSPSRGCTSATSASSATTSATSSLETTAMIARYRGGRPACRLRHAGARRGSRRLAAAARGAPRRLRPHRRARRGLGSSFARSTATSSRTRRGSWRRTTRARPTSTASSSTSPTACASSPSCWRLPPGDGAADPGRTRDRLRDLDWSGCASGGTRAADGIEPAQPALPARGRTRGRWRRDRHARAPRRLEDAAEVVARARTAGVSA